MSPLNATLHEQFQPAPEVHSRRFHDEVVILDLGAGKYFALDEVGSKIWDELNAGRTLAEVVEQLVALHEVDAETARADALRLADQLLTAGLIQRRR
jgi:hypothetical protein